MNEAPSGPVDFGATPHPATTGPVPFGGPPSSFPPPTPFRKKLRILAWIAAGLLAIFFALVAWLAVTAPLSRSLKPIAPPSITLISADARVIARKGAIIDKPVAIADLPKRVPEAFMAIEDRRFYSHWGIDPRGIARAMWRNLWAGGTKEGGSTITQQLAKGVFLTNDRTAGRKLREALIAFWLEAWLTKDQILERYLSNVYFGDNVYGLRAASLHYFNRQPERLTVAQAAMLAGLLKAPSRLAPTSNLEGARARAKLVIHAMVEAGFLTPEQERETRPAILDVTEAPESTSGTYFADWVLPEARDRAGAVYGAQDVTTTMDSKLQKIAEGAARRAPLGKAQVAIVTMKPDGSVVAMIGGKSYQKSAFNRAIQARRQPGSTFKLFVYLAAFRAGMTPDDMIDDTPITEGEYRPANHDRKYRGRITLRQAFAVSSNVAAVRLAEKVGIRNVIRAARDLGVRSPLGEDPSLALGTSEITLLELTQAYASVAAGAYPVIGHGLPPEEQSWLAKLMDRQKAFSDDELEMIRDLLSSAANRGTGSAAALRTSTFGKTGTTQDNRDALFVGYAGGLVTAVWVGNDDNTPLPGIAGGGIPARIWRDFTSRAIGEPTETETPADNDEDLVNAIANISVETNIGNLSIGVGPNGLNLDIAPLRPTEPAPSGPVAPPPLPATAPAQQPAEKQQ
ncbi:PBP1A family penicillin-binding protein [Sphingobium phenoxybenzoativorans]|uniref:PBP1A family penicillin-binding protein n=1 Tax=Sphingobium phenoxybenzoativorans TaxID=1592790 RepID=A0A975Q025_9SPHN|nr:PBP1A family penicillin-binding protein [Sphingobium phenoxybenzoativorans]QUT04420.1 PBP1A family penicillin-binding protein [Sphingobium phenoxybenzoativorans]